MMNVLIACEFSGIVRDAFLRRGHNAVSCDLLPTENPGPHYQGDVFNIINYGWDLMIAHPPCTYLTVSANAHFKCNPKRWVRRLEAVMFVWDLMIVDIKKIAVENPVGVLSTYIRQPDQYIQPYQFGDKDIKKTGLWLKNLPKLTPTNVVEPDYILYKSKKTKSGFSKYGSIGKLGKGHGKERSRTFSGIAEAMADQWGGGSTCSKQFTL